MTLGIDIGGTNIGLGLVEDGKLKEYVSAPSFPAGCTLDQTFTHLKDSIFKCLRVNVSGIGFGIPSVVDVSKGIVYDTANIPSWKEVHLKEVCEKEFGVPVAVNNDANCYALGAYMSYPREQRPEVLVAMTLGTGLGVGIIYDGKIFNGANCGAGELSCLPYLDSNLEEYTSKKFFSNQSLTPLQAEQAALAGDAGALALYEEFGRHIGYAVCTILFAYDPDIIVIGGGISKGYHLFRKAMEEYIRENFPYRKTLEKLRIEAMSNDTIPLIGAASLI